MIKKSVIVSVLVAFVAFVVLSLVRGAPYLETPLLGGLPLGNGLVALGLCALAGLALVHSIRGSALRVASLVSLLGAVLWLPVSVALAGNPQLNFSGGRGSIWLVLSVAVFAGSCSTLLWALGAAALAKIRGAGAA
ncbi:hypothetical protein [Luteimonas sp. A534]